MTVRKNVLYVHYSDNWIRGSEMCLMHLIDSLDRNRFTPFLWTNCIPLARIYQNKKIETLYSEFTLLGGWDYPKFDCFGWLKLVRQAIKFIRVHNIDLVHVNSGAPCQWMCLAARLCGVPLVTQLHSDYQLRDRFTLGLHLSPHTICVSEAISHGLLGDGYPKSKLSVIHNGVAEEFSTPINIRDRLNIPLNRFVFISVGSLIVRKGYDLIIQALHHLSGTIDCHLVIIGEGEERSNLKALVSKLNLTNRVHFVGEQHNVSDWLHSGVNAFISGARDEAFGLAIAEAGLAKLPVIAPRVGGIPEFIEHYHSGLLFSHSNAILDIAENMRKLASSKTLQITLAENLYQHASNKLTVSANTNAIQAIYEDMCCEPSNHRVPVSNGFKPLLRWTFR
ncbi:glycosyltransferase [Vibrio sp. T187]|uniref:glycosyltransferase n=1 Tax=Vibrio TaxID=662 RepID=UPI0010C9D942|nr:MULTISPECIES: glycosyltransferase [Vibrio]MBW3697806.1 glycosyltransferase [Vibrio sp. T187]